MSTVAFADVVHQTIYFSREVESEALALDLIDTAWFQRLRDVSQTGNNSLVYMFAEHSRFGHSVGVAYLANHLMNRLSVNFESDVKKYRTAISAAAVLHDIGHIAPGSHSAYRTWFPDSPDRHEEVATRIVEQDEEINALLKSYDPELPALVCAILSESSSLPPWVWEIISGGGWNVDRGNWCIVDSVMAGVSYGRYNIPALLESMIITDGGHLALRENRRDAMMHFAIARHSMYRQVYQHRVFLASETLNQAVVKRARALGDSLGFADKHAQRVLATSDPLELPLDTLFAMRESWWKYHLTNWQAEQDPILSDLATRLTTRHLLKTVRIREDDDAMRLEKEARAAVENAGFDPEYYLHRVAPSDIHAGDSRHSLMVQLDDGRLLPLSETERLWNAMMEETKHSSRAWLVLPEQAKKLLGRER